MEWQLNGDLRSGNKLYCRHLHFIYLHSKVLTLGSEVCRYLLIGRVAFPEAFCKWIADDFQLCHLQVE